MDIQKQLETITVTSWPLVKDCLAWSEDGIAVACNETLYVLTPKNATSSRASSGPSGWHIAPIQANRFTNLEWPCLQLAPTRHMSIGEEQSTSNIVSIAWSYPGLGMHKRSVLAVLTSNLILSLWETDGSLEPHRRTCVVNKSLLLSGTTGLGNGAERLATRIRAFCWQAPVIHGETSGSQHHLLVVANDAGSISVLKIDKASLGQYGGWKIHNIQQIQLPDLSTDQLIGYKLSPLQQMLYTESPITKITRHDAQVLNDSARSPAPVRSQTVLELHSLLSTRRLKMTLSVDTSHSSTEKESAVTVELQHVSGMPEMDIHSHQKDTNLEVDFKTALQPLCHDFDVTHELHGNLRVQFWGHAPSPDKSLAAACVTIHPSDVMEHTIPSAEKTFVLFRQTGVAKHLTPVAVPKKYVLQDLIDFTATSLKQSIPMISALDAKIAKVHHALISEQVNPSADSAVGSKQNCPEICEICNQGIPFSTDMNSARCLSGHQFTRCNLSFVSIQEPGIAKYCSECGKQFLDLSKLGMSDGPSLCRALFDAFDVCPYCQARFRG